MTDGIKNEYLVTKTETVKITARSESEALFLAEQCFDFFGPDTEDIDVEQLRTALPGEDEYRSGLKEG